MISIPTFIESQDIFSDASCIALENQILNHKHKDRYLSLSMFALHMHCQRDLRLKDGVTGTTSMIYSAHMQTFVKQQGSQCWITLVTDIDIFYL